jgi:hypothetical protein
MLRMYVSYHFIYEFNYQPQCSNEIYNLKIITGLRKGTSHEKLYTELGWVPLKECRRTNKIILLHKILHDETPGLGCTKHN